MKNVFKKRYNNDGVDKPVYTKPMSAVEVHTVDGPKGERWFGIMPVSDDVEIGEVVFEHATVDFSGEPMPIGVPLLGNIISFDLKAGNVRVHYVW